MRVLIDTNVLISASMSKTGNPYLAYLKAVSLPNQGVVCDQNLDELKRVYNTNSHSTSPRWFLVA